MSKQKFQEGDRVVISKKYKNRYNYITCVGTVTYVDDTYSKEDYRGFHPVFINEKNIDGFVHTYVSPENNRKLYEVEWDDKAFRRSYYSYELDKYEEPKKEKHMSTAKFKVGDTVRVNRGFDQCSIGKVYDISRHQTGQSSRLWYRVRFGNNIERIYSSYELDHYDKEHLLQPTRPVTFREEVHPGHVVIHEGGAISWVEDRDKGLGKTNQKDLPKKDKPKKDKPIQMVEFRPQDTVPHEEIKEESGRKYLKYLIDTWNDICDKYLYEFCDRHDYAYHPEDWVGGEVGTIIEISDMFVTMDNIRYDVDNNIDPEWFAKWYWKSLDIFELTGENYMNYPSYCKGAPDPWTKERLDSIRESKKRIEEAKQDLEDEIENYKKDSKKYF